MNIIRNMSIRKKIISIILILGMLGTSLGLTGLYYINKNGEIINSIYQDRLVPIKQLGEINSSVLQYRIYGYQIMVGWDIKQVKESLKKQNETIENIQKSYESSYLVEEEKKIYEKYKKDWDSYTSWFDDFVQLFEEGKTEEGNKTANEVGKGLGNQVVSDLHELIAIQERVTQELRTDAAKQQQTAMMIVVIMSVTMIVFGISFIVLSRQTIQKPIQILDIQLQKLVKHGGDLTQKIEVKSKDEIGRLAVSFNLFLDNLRQIISQVHDVSQKVAASSEELSASTEQNKQATTQIASSIQEVSSGADTQVKEIGEVVKTMEVMSQGIQRLAETSGVVSESSKETATAASKGNVSIQNAVSKLNKQSQEIGNIVNVITGISDQTHLLALNAAIEAAHAGDLGKGFAVVASEVKKLAEQSKESANQIASLVKEVQQGMIDVQKVGEAFHDIVSKAQHVANEIEKVSASTEEMSANSQEVTASIEQMGQIAKDSASNTQNVASASEEQLASFEEITASADALGHMATELQQLISKFKV